MSLGPIFTSSACDGGAGLPGAPCVRQRTVKILLVDDDRDARACDCSGSSAPQLDTYGAADRSLMELSKFILEDMEGILQDWEDFARTLPAASCMDQKQLRDHAGKILRAIASDMENTQSAGDEVSKSEGKRDAAEGQWRDSAAQAHGEGRLDDGFSAPEMVAEYRALRGSVVRRWRKRTRLPSDQALAEVTRFNEGIDQALSESTRRFSDKLDRSRELFMGALGHDLRGPLHVVLRAASYLQKPEISERKRADMVGYVLQSAEHMRRMIEDLLDVARTKLGGSLPVDPSSADAAEICDRVLAEMRALHPDRQFQLETTGDLRGIWDAARIEQLLSNLVSNAVQHGDPTKSITLQAQDDGESVLLSVHNEGEPIPQRLLDRVFEPLVRGERAQDGTRSAGNMGLGLYIASTVARAHSGSIDVQSSKAGGTTFKVSLPRKPRE
jgi:signal transduction histidine kinase